MIQLRITTHSGLDKSVEVETYDSANITAKRNDDKIQAIEIGNNSYSRIDLKNIIVENGAKSET